MKVAYVRVGRNNRYIFNLDQLRVIFINNIAISSRRIRDSQVTLLK